MKISAWYGEQLAHFLERLAQYPEGKGTLLDHTAVVWCNEVGQGNDHSHQDLPSRELRLIFSTEPEPAWSAKLGWRGPAACSLFT